MTFKYGLGEEFIDVLRKLHLLGLDSKDPVRVGEADVAPRDLVAAVLPDPASLGERMSGKTCAGTLVTGSGTDGAERSVYLYHVADNEQTMREYGCQAVVWQTAINPVIALELLADGSWKATGSSGPRRSTRMSFSLACDPRAGTTASVKGAPPVSSSVEQAIESGRILADRERYVARGVATTPLVVARAEGARIWDVDGREYIDFAGGLGCQNTGHGFAASLRSTSRSTATSTSASWSGCTSRTSRSAGCSTSSGRGRASRRSRCS